MKESMMMGMSLNDTDMILRGTIFAALSVILTEVFLKLRSVK